MPPSDGREFGKYKLLARIAMGGMAEIYRARMTAAAGVTKPVAIKKILPHYAGHPAFVSMFINEARIAVGLSHGNIVHVFDFGEVDGEYYLAMEWVHGQALSRVLRRAQEKGLAVLPPPLALMVAGEMLQGLAYAHTRLDEEGRPLHIVHRDVSPQNVLVSYEGEVKLVDFGIARARRARGPEEGAVPQGKYLYFAPEQARGQEPDARSDIFAAGSVLYELLCGQRPFEGEAGEVLERLAAGDFPRPRAINPALPPSLERLVLTALAPEPAQRYPTTQAFHEAVARYLHTAVPDFSPSALGHFMAYLFEPELVAEGRPVQLPRDFLTQLEGWSRGLPQGTPTPPPFVRDEEDVPTAPRSRASAERITQPIPAVAGPPEPLAPPAAAPPRRITQPVPTVPAPAERPLPPVSERLRAVRPGGSRRLRPWHGLAALTLGAGVLLAGFLLATLESANHFAVELTSTPPGASVRVDGRDWPAPTPALITRLEADREHLIEVRLGGMQPWSQRVHAEHGDTLAVHAPLPPERRPASTPPVARLPALPQEGRYPLSGFIVSTGHHALRVPPSPAARLGLDPRKSYVVSTASQPRPAFDVIYLLTGGARLAARESFGLVGPSPTTVRHASSLYLFVLGAPSAAGHLEVHVREELSGAVTTVSVEASHNTVALPPQARFTLRGLDPAATYELLLREMDPPAHTRGRQGAPVGQVLSLQGGAQGETQGSARVLEVGHPYRVTGAAWVLFTFPDDELGDNLGALSVDVTPVPLPRSPAASRPPGRG